MKRAIVFANGLMDAAPHIVPKMNPSDLVIAADGGSLHCKSLGITPNIIIGDLDSLDPVDVSAYQRAGVIIIQYPSHKDETDLELALQYILEHGIEKVIVAGALGARWDMTFANILLIANKKFETLSIKLVTDTYEFTLVRGNGHLDINNLPGYQLSLLPLNGDVHGITTHGLEYPLKDESLYFGSTRGVSNIVTQPHASIQVSQGTLLCILTQNAGTSTGSEKEGLDDEKD